MSLNDDNNSKWNKIRNKTDCEITQPATPALCYPKSDTNNHPFTEKLFKYRKLHGNKCDPNPSQPCVLDHTGLVLPGAKPEPPSTDIILKSVGNELVVWVCEDFFQSTDDKEDYKGFNGTVLVPVKKTGKDESGKDVYEDLETNKSVVQIITAIYNDFVTNLGAYSESEGFDDESQKTIFTYSTSKIEDNPSNFPDYFTTYFKYNNTGEICSINFEETITQDSDSGNQTTSGVNLVLKNINGGISIVLPNTYVQWYQEGVVDSVEQAQITVNNLAITQAYSTIECYVCNDEVTGICPNDSHLIDKKTLVDENTIVDKNTLTIEKNRFKQTLSRELQNESTDASGRIIQVTWGEIENSIPNNTIDSWKDIYDETNKLARDLLNTSLKCEYGNLEQTAYCTYPVLYSKDKTQTVVYGLLPDQLVKHDDVLKDSCAITTDSLISISSLNKDEPNNETHVKYENNTYNYFTIDPETGEYNDNDDDSVFSIVKPDKGKLYFTLGKDEEGGTCNFDYCFDNDNITNGKLNVKTSSNKKAGYYIGPFYSGENNSTTVAEHSITKTFTYGELTDATVDLKKEVNDLDAQAFTQASTSLFCQYGNPFYGAQCPTGTELPGGSQCTISTLRPKTFINVSTEVTGQDKLLFVLQKGTNKFYICENLHVPVVEDCEISGNKKEFIANFKESFSYDTNVIESLCTVHSREEGATTYTYKTEIEIRFDDLPIYLDESEAVSIRVYEIKDVDPQGESKCSITYLDLGEFPVEKRNTDPLNLQLDYTKYDACVDKNVIALTTSTAESLNSAKAMVDTQIPSGCLIQNVEVKAFCDYYTLIEQKKADGCSKDCGAVISEEDIQTKADYFFQSLTKTLYIYKNKFYAQYDAEAWDPNWDSTWKKPTQVVGAIPGGFSGVTPEGVTQSSFPTPSVGAYSCDQSSDGVSHCIAVDNISTAIVPAGTYSSNKIEQLATLNKNAALLAISSISCLYGNAKGGALNCNGTPIGPSTYYMQESGALCSSCAIARSSSSVESNIFLAETPWNADLQALTVMLASRICIPTDRVGGGGGGGGGEAAVKIEASCSASCSECEKAYCVFRG